MVLQLDKLSEFAGAYEFCDSSHSLTSAHSVSFFMDSDAVGLYVAFISKGYTSAFPYAMLQKYIARYGRDLSTDHYLFRRDDPSKEPGTLISKTRAT